MNPGTLSARSTITDTQRQRLRALCRQSLFGLVSGILSWRQRPNLITEDVFYDSCHWATHDILLGRKRGWGADPRAHTKSTRWTIGIPIWLSIQRPDPAYDSPEEYNRARTFLASHPWLRGPDMRILIASASKDNSRRFLRRISDIYTSDPLFRFLFPELNPDIATLTWNQYEITLPGRTTPYAEPFVDTAGVTSRSTSRHYDLILYDDPINEDNWQSETEIQSSIDWLLLAENLLESPDPSNPLGGAILGIGNSWTMYDTLAFVRENLSTYDVWLRSCWRCTVCGSSRCRQTPDCAYTSEPLWPARFSRSALLDMRERQGVKIFSAQLENNPVDPESTSFARSDLRWCALDEPSSEILVFEGQTRHVTARVPYSSCRWFMACDPAVSTDPRSCRSAVGVFADAPDGNIYFIDLIAAHLSPGSLIDAILARWVVHHASNRPLSTFGVEGVSGQRFIIPALNFAARSHTPAIHALSSPPSPDNPNIVLFHPDARERKADRISNLLGWRANTHTLYVNVALPHLDDFITEWDYFPSARSNDIVDMLAYAQTMCEGTRNTSRTVEVNRRRARQARRARLYSYGGW